MELVQGLLAGIILGWLIEWVMDLHYWRRDDTKLGEKLANAEARIHTLEAALTQAQRWKIELEEKQIALNQAQTKAQTLSTLLAKYTDHVVSTDPAQTIDLSRSKMKQRSPVIQE